MVNALINSDLIQKESGEIAVIKQFLPQQWSIL